MRAQRILGSEPVIDAGPGTVETLFGGMGTLSMTADRTQENTLPWVAPAAGRMLRKLTHFRAPGLGDPMWSGRCVYDLQGQAESVSEYERPDTLARDDGLGYSITAGIVKTTRGLSEGEPTLTRASRVAAHFDSAPAASHFQGYMNTRWSGMLAGFRPVIQPRPLVQNFNPNMAGAKELHKATQYKPFPPMGSIVSFYGDAKAV